MLTGENKDFTLIRCHDNAEWLQQRTHGIGGSDVAAIMGISKYKSAYALYMEKVGLLQPEDISDKPAVHWGCVLEPIVGEEYKKNHPKREVRRVNAICKSIKRPWAQASLDYEVKDEELGWGVLEIKTAGLNRAKDWEDGIPLYYQTQIIHYLSVLNRPFADVAVLIGGQDYREFRYMRDIEDEKALVKDVDNFWHQNVEAGVVPDIDATYADAQAVLAAGTPSTGEIIDYTDDITPFERFMQAKAAKDRADEYYKLTGNKVKKLIGDSKGVNTPLGKFTWVRGTSSKFDMKAFSTEHADLKDKYMTEYKRDGGIRVTVQKG